MSPAGQRNSVQRGAAWQRICRPSPGQAGRFGGSCLEGEDSKYRPGPSTNWLKAKCYAIDEFDLLGVEHEPANPLSLLWLTVARGAM